MVVCSDGAVLSDSAEPSSGMPYGATAVPSKAAAERTVLSAGSAERSDGSAKRRLCRPERQIADGSDHVKCRNDA